jgi:hypothetical protein
MESMYFMRHVNSKCKVIRNVQFRLNSYPYINCGMNNTVHQAIIIVKCIFLVYYLKKNNMTNEKLYIFHSECIFNV